MIVHAQSSQVDELTGVLETQKIALDQAQGEYQQAMQDCEAMKEVMSRDVHMYAYVYTCVIN